MQNFNNLLKYISSGIVEQQVIPSLKQFQLRGKHRSEISFLFRKPI